MLSQNNSLYDQAEKWADHLRSNQSFTPDDTEELKEHFIDLSSDLQKHGLSEDEALFVAASRLEVNSALQKEYEHINMPVVLLRRIALLLLGSILLILLSNFELFSIRFMSAVFARLSDNVNIELYHVIWTIILHHLIILGTAWYLGSNSQKLAGKLGKYQFSPSHSQYIFIILIILLIGNLVLRLRVDPIIALEQHSAPIVKLIIDLNSVTYPFLLICCFISLRYKYGSDVNAQMGPKVFSLTYIFESDEPIDYEIAKKLSQRSLIEDCQRLMETGLSKNEASTILLMRLGVITNFKLDAVKKSSSIKRSISIIAVGALIFSFLNAASILAVRLYLNLSKLLGAETSILLKRAWTLTNCFYLIIIIMTIGIYSYNQYVCRMFKWVLQKNIYVMPILFITGLIGFANTSLFDHLFGFDQDYYASVQRFLWSTEYSLPLVLFACFTALAFKYYKNKSTNNMLAC